MAISVERGALQQRAMIGRKVGRVAGRRSRAPSGSSLADTKAVPRTGICDAVHRSIRALNASGFPGHAARTLRRLEKSAECASPSPAVACQNSPLASLVPSPLHSPLKALRSLAAAGNAWPRGFAPDCGEIHGRSAAPRWRPERSSSQRTRAPGYRLERSDWVVRNAPTLTALFPGRAVLSRAARPFKPSP